MERPGMILALVLALASPLQAGVEIVVAGDRLDVIAAVAPVAEVLDGLARKTRMKVVYDGTIPRTPVTVELRDQTLAQAVLGVLEGLGLNYALVLDPSGTRVETLMIVGTGPRAVPAPAVRPPPRPVREPIPLADLDNAMENEEAPSSGEEGAVPTISDGAKADENAKPAPGPAAPLFGPMNPPRGFPNVSPFAPAPPALVTPTPSPSPASND